MTNRPRFYLIAQPGSDDHGGTGQQYLIIDRAYAHRVVEHHRAANAERYATTLHKVRQRVDELNLHYGPWPV